MYRCRGRSSCILPRTTGFNPVAESETATPTTSPLPSLYVHRDGVVDRVVEFVGDELIIGRVKCDVVLNEPTVSTRHARVFRRADGYFLEDLNSRNNTVLDGQKLKGRGPVPLLEGQAFRICDYWLLFQSKITIDEAEHSSAIRGVVEATTSSSLGFVPTKPEETVKALLAVGNALGNTLDLRLILDKALESLFVIFPQTDRGFVYLGEPAVGVGSVELTPIASRNRNRDNEPMRISRVVLDEVLRGGSALCCEDLAKDKLLAGSDTMMGAGIRTMLCAPILDRDRHPIGLLQLDSRDYKHQFEPKDLELLVAVVAQIGVAVENARLHEVLLRRKHVEQELTYARKVLHALLPDRTPQVPGFSFWHHYEPANEVGGDYFGYVALSGPDEAAGVAPKLAIAVADVVGHGMGAALLMVKLSAEVQFSLGGTSEPPRVLEQLNQRLCELAMEDKFVTFLLVLLDAERGALTVVSAGHPSPVIRRADGRVEDVDPESFGIPLGILETAAYRTCQIQLQPGDCAVLYTDGITEAFDSKNHQFGLDRFNQAVARASGFADAVGNSIMASVHDHRGNAPQSDDITLICLARRSDHGTIDLPAPHVATADR